MVIDLPYPVSLNRNLRNVKGNVLVSKEAKQYKSDVGWLAKAAGCKVMTGDISVSVNFHPKTNKDGSASKTRLDIDNVIKTVFDAMNGVCWVDDKQVVRLFIEIGKPILNGGLTVVVDEIKRG